MDSRRDTAPPAKEVSKLTTYNQKYIVKPENFDTLAAYRHDARHVLKWDCLFVLPEWLKVWWAVFGKNADLNVLSVSKQNELIGLAPLQVKGLSASFIGDDNVCDYLDFIVKSGQEEVFFAALLDHLDRQGIKQLEFGLVRPDSTVYSNLVELAENRGCDVSTSSKDVTLELELPANWDAYLGMLNGKQRHEVKRKFRRLDEAGDIDFRIVNDAAEIAAHLPTFLELFKMSSEEKTAFMTDQMISFFQALTSAMANSEILKLYTLSLNAATVAISMCFDFNSRLHLHNCGFDPRFRALSVGLMCKVHSIKDGIERGRKKYDFLKGAETYKYRLSGREVPLYKCRIQL